MIYSFKFFLYRHVVHVHLLREKLIYIYWKGKVSLPLKFDVEVIIVYGIAT